MAGEQSGSCARRPCVVAVVLLVVLVAIVAVGVGVGVGVFAKRRADDTAELSVGSNSGKGVSNAADAAGADTTGAVVAIEPEDDDPVVVDDGEQDAPEGSVVIVAKPQDPEIAVVPEEEDAQPAEQVPAAQEDATVVEKKSVYVLKREGSKIEKNVLDNFEGPQHIYSFDRKRNADVCNNRMAVMAWDPSIKDYSAIMSKTFQELAEAGGGTLVLGKGVYPISQPVDMERETCLKGAGMGTAAGTVIRVIDNAPPWNSAGILRVWKGKYITVQDVCLDGNKDNQNVKTADDRYGRFGFFSSVTDFVWLRRVKVVNNPGYGFDPHGEKDPKKWSKKLIIEDCEATNNGLDGYTIDQTSDATIINSVARDNGRHGVNIVTGTRYALCSGMTIINNGFEDSGGGGCGIAVQSNFDFSTKNVLLAGNSITNSKRAGICVSETRAVEARENTISAGSAATTSDCFAFGSSKEIILSSNTCNVAEGQRFDIDTASGDASYKETDPRGTPAQV